MTTYEYVESNIGKQVYIDGGGDLAMDGDLKPFIMNKTPLTLIRLNKKGLAIVKDNKEVHYSVPPKNINIFENNNYEI